MENKKLGLIIAVIGIAILSYGIIQYFVNQPDKFDSSKSEMGVFGRNDIGNLLDTKIGNLGKKEKQKDATTYMIVGGVVVLVGGGISFSGKKKS